MDASESIIKTKICGKCKIEKPFADFTKSKNGLFKLHNFCKICLKQYNKEIYQRDKEKVKESVKEWNADHIEETKIYKARSYYKKIGKRMPKRTLPNPIPDAQPLPTELDF